MTDPVAVVAAVLAPATATAREPELHPAHVHAPAQPVAIGSVDLSRAPRLETGIADLDRVLGGGLVPGVAILLGGEPGAGKSTLLMQALASLASAYPHRGRVLYATGEESIDQTAMRAHRLGVGNTLVDIVSETDVDRVLANAYAGPRLALAIDSIQTVRTSDLDAAPGGVSQVRECTDRLVRYAKATGTPLILVGHITKDGALAGPKTLEHAVDVVLTLEGDGGPYRTLRAHKNRFGSTQEVGVLEMTAAGMSCVDSPSSTFLAERAIGAPGSIVTVTIQGSRATLLEIQALAAQKANPDTAGKCAAMGVDPKRVAMLLAVASEHTTIDAFGRDTFVSVAGGVRLSEPAADLAIVLAIASSHRKTPIDATTIAFGEIGLAGEIRSCPQYEARIAEAVRLGFTRAIVPAYSGRKIPTFSGIEIVGVDRLSIALEIALPHRRDHDVRAGELPVPS